MSKIFPLARSKRSKSVSDVFILHDKDDLIAQPKITGISCHVVVSGENISIYNRIGFNLTKLLKDSDIYSCIKSLSINDFHGLSIIQDDKMIFYDCLRFDNKKLADMKLTARLDTLNRIEFSKSKSLSVINTLPVSDIDTILSLGYSEIILKSKKSKYPVQAARGKELCADWYSIRIFNKNERDAIVDSYYFGNLIDGKKEVIFKCKQYSKNKIIQIGKVRIKDEKIRRKIIGKLNKGKRVVCRIEIEKYDSFGRFKKLKFLYLKKDKPFSSVIVDSSRIVSPVEIINVSTKKKTSFER